MRVRVEIDVYYIPTGQHYGKGVQWLASDEEFDGLKDLLADAVRGEIAFLKLYTPEAEIFIGREILISSKITLVRCEKEQI